MQISDIYSIFLSVAQDPKGARLPLFRSLVRRALPGLGLYDNIDTMAQVVIREKNPGRVQNGILQGSKNLIPVTKRTKEEARELSVRGGKHSQELQRERKTMSMLQIYQRWLDTDHAVKIAGKIVRLKGSEIVSRTMGKIIIKGNKDSVAMITEVRKAIEGTTYHIDGGTIDDDLNARGSDDLRAELEAELAKRDAIQARRAGETVVEGDAAPSQTVGVEVIEETGEQATGEQATTPEVLKAGDTGSAEVTDDGKTPEGDDRKNAEGE